MDILKLCVKCYKERDQNEFQLQNGKTSKRCKSCRDSINKYYSEYRKTENYQDWLQTSMKEHQKKSYQKNIQNRKEYYNKNKDKLSEYNKQYRIDHLEDAHKREKQYRIEHLDEIKKRQKLYKDENQDKIKEYRKKYYETNKDKILTKIECPCGGHYTQNQLSRHELTKKHQIYVNQK